jgi:UDP-GlcNAc:undecaprenyl-phosphate GlcNAc-1-phosphate transferase
MNPLVLILVALVALAVTGLTVPYLIKYAWKRQHIDRPDGERKKHGRPTPTLGGLAIVAGVIAGMGTLAVAGYWGTFWSAIPSVGVWSGAALMIGVGIYDDTRETNHKVKFVFQLLAGYILLHAGYRIDLSGYAFIGGDPYTEALYSIPLTLLWVVGVINAVNLMDGLDGLAAGISLIGFFSMAAIMAGQGLAGGLMVAVIMMGALAGFLIHNYHPAIIFMGDSGSLFLGFMLAAGSLELQAYADSTMALLVPVVLLGVPIIDTAVTILRRFLSGASIFYPDHDHVHHRLREAFSHERAVLILYGVALWFGTAAFLMASLPAPWPYVVFGVVVVTTGVGLHLVGYLQARAILRAARLRYIKTQRQRAQGVQASAGAAEAAPVASSATGLDTSASEAAPKKPAPHRADESSKTTAQVEHNGTESTAASDERGDGIIENSPPYLVPFKSSGEVSSDEVSSG